MTSLTENKQLTPVQCALTKSLDLKSFRMRTYEKQAVVGATVCFSSS